MNFLSDSTNYMEILCIEDGKIPLYQGRDDEKILYISSLALRLSKSHNSQAMEIASEMVAYLSAHCGEIFKVKIVPPVWIYVELTHLTLADWLHSITVKNTELKSIENNCSIINTDKLVFTIQYSHARCCSLLRLAHREGLIELVDNSLNLGDFQSAQSIPWLDDEQKLRLNQPDEVRLIQQLLKLVDDLVYPDAGSSVNWGKAGLKLSQAFDSFWRNCRIWGEVKINSWELAQARLGLLMATQLVLRSVLETKLGAFAPPEL
ncbi:anticodon-binding protein [Anabaena lutea FACHB-196]|uniref:Anticodon-binding protein n=2 Tax=Anabaena TaxID=1163 RepID=A0ABR8F9K5_9NOST|nr:anticodon-binding protein [Anabaena lutea FACHB-196]